MLTTFHLVARAVSRLGVRCHGYASVSVSALSAGVRVEPLIRARRTERAPTATSTCGLRPERSLRRSQLAAIGRLVTGGHGHRNTLLRPGARSWLVVAACRPRPVSPAFKQGDTGDTVALHRVRGHGWDTVGTRGHGRPFWLFRAATAILHRVPRTHGRLAVEPCPQPCP